MLASKVQITYSGSRTLNCPDFPFAWAAKIGRVGGLSVYKIAFMHEAQVDGVHLSRDRGGHLSYIAKIYKHGKNTR